MLYMFNKSTLVLLSKYFDKVASLKWSMAGTFFGTAAWIWGESKIPTRALKFASGLGWALVTPMFAAIILFFMAYFLQGRVGSLAYRGFQNTVCWVHPKLLRTISVFHGLILSAGVCWIATDSAHALKTVLQSAVLILSLLWIWATLLVAYDKPRRIFRAI